MRHLKNAFRGPPRKPPRRRRKHLRVPRHWSSPVGAMVAARAVFRRGAAGTLLVLAAGDSQRNAL